MKYQQYYLRCATIVAALVLAGCKGTITPVFQETKTPIAVNKNFTERNIRQLRIAISEKSKPAIVQIKASSSGSSTSNTSISTGSGVIVKPTGYVLTNSHCIPLKPTDIKVVRYKKVFTAIAERSIKEEYAATLIDRDAAKDLALLQLHNVQQEDLPYLSLDKDPEPQRGDMVFALGHPWGQDYSCIQGFHQGLLSRESTEFISHNAQIRPGNSGGVLVDCDGEIIGINSQIIPMIQGDGHLEVKGLAIPFKPVFLFLLKAYDKHHKAEKH